MLKRDYEGFLAGYRWVFAEGDGGEFGIGVITCLFCIHNGLVERNQSDE